MGEARSEEDQALGIYVNLLRPAVADLAMTGEEQVAWMRRTGFPSDELALQFEDAYLCVGMPQDQGWLTDQVLKLLAQIDELLSEMSGPQYERWSDQALLQGADWAQLRSWASTCLELMPQRPSSNSGSDSSR